MFDMLSFFLQLPRPYSMGLLSAVNLGTMHLKGETIGEKFSFFIPNWWAKTCLVTIVMSLFVHYSYVCTVSNHQLTAKILPTQHNHMQSFINVIQTRQSDFVWLAKMNEKRTKPPLVL